MAKAKKKVKKVAAKKSAPKTKGKKIDGKALAANRKPRDTVAQFVKDELTKGRRDVDKILAGAQENFPKTKATRGYIRFIAREMKIDDLKATERSSEKPKAKPAAKAKAKGEKKQSTEKAEKPAADKAEQIDPAS